MNVLNKKRWQGLTALGWGTRPMQAGPKLRRRYIIGDVSAA